ncbi:hypothetical protein M427DRAFT_63846 [Gonapodya prolifera JEL478]|uniref:GH16 domain-containing protein n=1 Tax=Gonapodya prolifera (strain JEL478) TaxID=1344416 RepID=A0A138ZYI8_GONPJ|nr:hypothetical protein M427DRAFT_63846 [Gonapodya prolifera JEL478]|eukprot:KXS09550.1 hypothetical protein M427DRAFT_63846 [Gonapodya prolifera JEL478]
MTFPTPGWDLQGTGGRQGLATDSQGRSQWALHSIGNGGDGWSRMRYSLYTFNGHAAAWTNIKVKARGAPDGGKNSNAYLIQTKGQYNNDAAVQDGTKDEVDIWEYYGGRNDATYNIFRRGTTPSGYPKSYSVSDAYSQAYTYEIILDNAKRTLEYNLYNEAGSRVGHLVETDSAKVPSEAMELFLGIWDCRGNSWCPGSFNGDSWMGVFEVYVKGC